MANTKTYTIRDIQIINQQVMGLVVCAPRDINLEELTELTNAACYCGTSTGWVLPDEGSSLHGKDVACEQDADRRHFVFTC